MLSRAAAGLEPRAIAASAGPASHLHVRIIGASAAFGSDPVDILGRVLDVASLAVNAVLGVDLKPWFATLVIHEFINACRAITLLWTSVDGKIDRRGYVGVLERQMNRLVFFVIGVRHEHRRQPVEGQLAVWLGIIDRLGFRLGLEHFMVGLVLERPRQAEAKLAEPQVEAGIDRAELASPMGNGRLGVANELQLLDDPALVEDFWIGFELVARAVLLNGLKR